MVNLATTAPFGTETTFGGTIKKTMGVFEAWISEKELVRQRHVVFSKQELGYTVPIVSSAKLLSKKQSMVSWLLGEMSVFFGLS